MNKTMNLIAILLIITFVNSTKTISFSDIVSSLVQLSDDENTGESNLKLIIENFESSNRLLTNLQTNVHENCNKLASRYEETFKNLNEKISKFEKAITDLTDENTKLVDEITNDQESVKSEVSKISGFKASIEEANKAAVQKENAIHESINVLLRLKNIANDELLSLKQKTTDMVKFEVTKTTSFIQKSNLETELKTILSKSDSSNRGLISTLIMLTQSIKADGYANPESVQKIIDLIDKIIDNSREKISHNNLERDETVSGYTDLIRNSDSSIADLKETIQRKLNAKITNEKEIIFYKNDVIFFQKAFNRREKRAAFSKNLCQGQENLVNRHFENYQNSLVKVEALKTELFQ